MPAAEKDLSLSLSDFDAVIVDLDGTLVDTLADFVAALNLMLAGLPLPAGTPRTIDGITVEHMVGKGSEHLVRAVLHSLLGPTTTHATRQPADALFEPAFAAYQSHYEAVNGRHASVYPGVAEGLSMLQGSGLKMACLTNKPLRFARELLELKSLDRFFLLVFGGDSFDRKKPDPLPLLKTCEALGSRPERTLMIGDSSNDAQAARSAGCPVVLVTYGYNHGEPVRQVDADGFISSLTALRFTT